MTLSEIRRNIITYIKVVLLFNLSISMMVGLTWIT